MPALYRLPRYHVETFGFDRPVSIPYMTRVIFDWWDLGRLIKPLDFLMLDIKNLNMTMDEIYHYAAGNLHPCLAFEYVTEEKKREVWEKYVRDVEITKPVGGCIPEHGMERRKHQDLIVSVKKEGIKVPITICDFEGDRNVHEFRVCEGKHRVGAALAAGMKTIPALEIVRAGGVRPMISGWRVTVWEFADIVQRAVRKYEEG